jgi:hypothetical protein
MHFLVEDRVEQSGVLAQGPDHGCGATPLGTDDQKVREQAGPACHRAHGNQ